MLIATAGHVDHGKTALIRALTKVDTDRLPEEKARGLTIDLGYAYLPNERGGITGFIDVPGHERFIANMLAGLSGIDAALLVVAADDGPMPQTLEHLEALAMMGITQFVVAISKSDLVASERLAAVEAALGALLARWHLTPRAIVATDALQGKGIDALAATLGRLEERPKPQGRRFRMAIDRTFSIKGSGLIATGTVLSGRVSLGDSLALSPQGGQFRVRGLRAQDQPVESAGVGERCAINLAGGQGQPPRRGGWLCQPGSANESRRLDVRVFGSPNQDRALDQDLPVHLHIGTADVTGRLVLLDRRQLAPGETALGQLLLDRPVDAVQGDPFILRDTSGQKTLAGGLVISPNGEAKGRTKPTHLALLRASDKSDDAAALTAALATGAAVDLTAFARQRGLTEERLSGFSIPDCHRFTLPQGDILIPRQLMTRWLGTLPQLLLDYHQAQPQDAGLSLQKLRKLLDPQPAPAVAAALVQYWGEEGLLRHVAGSVAALDHRPRMAKTDLALWESLRARLTEAGRQAPVSHELALTLEQEPEVVVALLARAARLGLVFRITRTRFLLTAVLGEFTAIIESLPNDSFDLNAFRAEAGIGRNLSIEVLEFFDRRGLTRREGNKRRVLTTASQIFGDLRA